MKSLYLILASLFLFSCSDKSETLKLVSFDVIDERWFEICFNESIENMRGTHYYTLDIFTKTGQKYTRDGVLVGPYSGSCYKQDKMQYSSRAYTNEKMAFLRDDLIDENIQMVRWQVYEKDSEPIAEGELEVKSL